ncbi:MAG: hypothetical protein ABII18_05770 [bacterium]
MISFKKVRYHYVISLIAFIAVKLAQGAIPYIELRHPDEALAYEYIINTAGMVTYVAWIFMTFLFSYVLKFKWYFIVLLTFLTTVPLVGLISPIVLLLKSRNISKTAQQE